MRSRLLALAAAMALLAGVVMQHMATWAAAPQTEAANAAVQYIQSLQNIDGGFPAFGAGSSPGATIDAAFALKAAGVDPATLMAVPAGYQTTAEYLISNILVYTTDDAGAAAKLALGFAVMDLDAESQDLLQGLGRYVDAETGAYGSDLFDEVLYVLALEAGGQAVPATTIDHLRAAQQADGGWEFSGGAGSDSNTTAMAMQALLGGGVAASSPTIVGGLGYLGTAQNADGGFAFVAGSDSDPNSTALVIQALVAAEQNIDAGGPWDRSGSTPMGALLSFRNATTGAFQYGGKDSPFATYQAVPALMLAPFPDLETRVVVGPTPVAPTAVAVTPTAMPAPVLPGAGGRAGSGGNAWWPAAALAITGGAVVASGLVARRARRW